MTKAARTVLKDAMYGIRIDLSHPVAVKYLERKESPLPGIDPLYSEALKACQNNGRYTAHNIKKNINVGYNRAKRILATINAAGADKPVVIKRGWGARAETKKKKAREILENESFADMTLTEVVKIYGTDIAFLDWLKAMKEIENINEKRLKNTQTRKELVNIKLVKNGVVKPFTTMSDKLITDGAKTIARRVTSMHGAGRSVKDCEIFVADQISTFIKRMKLDSLRVLRNNV